MSVRQKKFEQRRNEYIATWFGNRTKKENARLTNAARFYGAEALSFKLLELVNDQSLLTERERYWYWHYKAQEELGLCEVANAVEPSENPMRDPEVVARRSANPEWRMGQVERAKRARARVYQGFVAISLNCRASAVNTA